MWIAPYCEVAPTGNFIVMRNPAPRDDEEELWTECETCCEESEELEYKKGFMLCPMLR